jgi:ferritin
MLDKKVIKAINEQIAKEFYSGWLYLQMAAYFEARNLKGFAHWLRVQAQEEGCHGLIFFNHVCERGGLAELGAVASPGLNFKSALDVFEKGLKHEYTVTASIGNIMKLAMSVNDFATQSMLKWFVDEQVEEEANFDEISSKLRLIGDKDGNGLILMDKDLSARMFTLPPPLVTAAP